MKAKVMTSIEEGRRMMGLDLLVRTETGEIATEKNCGVIDLYRTVSEHPSTDERWRDGWMRTSSSKEIEKWFWRGGGEECYTLTFSIQVLFAVFANNWHLHFYIPDTAPRARQEECIHELLHCPQGILILPPPEVINHPICVGRFIQPPFTFIHAFFLFISPKPIRNGWPREHSVMRRLSSYCPSTTY